MKYFILMAIFLLMLACSTAPAAKEEATNESPCYLEAPLPHYDAEKGYGYLTDVRCTPEGPEYVNEIQKVWQFGLTREIFVDDGRDGTCDKALIFTQVDKEKDLWSLRAVYECKYVDDQIKNFLRQKEGREEI